MKEHTIRLRSGKLLDLLHPRPSDFTFADISGALSKICRYNGQIDRFYSVAEHCVHVLRQAEKDGAPLLTQRLALMHDSAEAFVGDVTRPLRKVLSSRFATLEAKLRRLIEAKYVWMSPAQIKRHVGHALHIDDEMLYAERRVIFGALDPLPDGFRLLRVDFQFWDCATAEREFVSKAQQLGMVTNF